MRGRGRSTEGQRGAHLTLHFHILRNLQIAWIFRQIMPRQSAWHTQVLSPTTGPSEFVLGWILGDDPTSYVTTPPNVNRALHSGMSHSPHQLSDIAEGLKYPYTTHTPPPPYPSDIKGL